MSNTDTFASVEIKGVPAMSKNCLSFMEQVIELNGYKSLLEYGSGNSTIYFLKAALKGPLPLREIVSIECSSDFFWRMYDIIIKELKPESTKIKSLIPGKLNYKRLQALESWFILFHSYVNDYFEACRVAMLDSNIMRVLFNFKAFRRRIVMIKKYFGLFMIKRNYILDETGQALVGRDRDIEIAFTFKGGIMLRYILAPVAMEHYINDGTYNAFFPYVEAPGTMKYDVVFIDGRARVSCLKKIISDNNASVNGVIFHHDAFLENYWEGFNILSTEKRLFLDGNNLKIDGTLFRDPESNAQKNIVLTKINEKHELSSSVVNEMMIYPMSKDVKMHKTGE